MFIIILTLGILGIILAPLGCLILWKKYTYYGDGLAHSTMLALIVSSIIGANIFLTALIGAILFSCLIFQFSTKSDNNASVNLVSSSMLSVALILGAIFPTNINISHLIFGDPLSANLADIYILLVLLSLVSCYLLINYKNLILIILSRDIARSKGIKVDIIEILFLLILSFSIIITIKIVGALLVTSLLIIPAMTARILAKTPIQMIYLAIIIIEIMNIFGLSLSYYTDLPLAPTIIICGLISYLISFITAKFDNK